VSEEPDSRVRVSMPVTVFIGICVFILGALLGIPMQRAVTGGDAHASAVGVDDTETRLREMERIAARLGVLVEQLGDDMKQVKSDVRELLAASRRR
jgi:hypothetical protein